MDYKFFDPSEVEEDDEEEEEGGMAVIAATLKPNCSSLTTW